MSGCLFVISAPSGAGKTSLVKELLKRDPHVKLSVSYTTRPPRAGEQDGVDYHFVSVEQFAAMRDAGEFLESAEVHGNFYGTSHRWINEQTKLGNDILLEIDWQGAFQVRRLIPSVVSIFVLPPSLEILRERLVGRGKDALQVIERRLAAAREEISHAGEFDYVIINQDFAAAADDFAAIVRATRLTTALQLARNAALLDDLTHI